MIFPRKVLLSKTNVMQEKLVRQKKRKNSGMLKGLGCFLGRKWAVAVPIFTLFSLFKLIFMPNHIYEVCSNRKKATAEEKCVIGPHLP